MVTVAFKRAIGEQSRRARLAAQQATAQARRGADADDHVSLAGRTDVATEVNRGTSGASVASGRHGAPITQGPPRGQRSNHPVG